jgi:hypothetical protein
VYRLCSIFVGNYSYCALLDPARLCISNTCAQGIRSSSHFGDWNCRMLCIVDHIRARNGRFHRMCCTLGTDTSLFSGDAQIARTTYSNFGTLSYLFGAILIHNERKPSRVRSDDDSIQISLIRFFTQRPCLDLRCQALTYLRSGLAWTSAARPLLTYLLT